MKKAGCVAQQPDGAQIRYSFLFCIIHILLLNYVHVGAKLLIAPSRHDITKRREGYTESRFVLLSVAQCTIYILYHNTHESTNTEHSTKT